MGRGPAARGPEPDGGGLQDALGALDGTSWSVVDTPNPEPFPGAGAGLWGVDASGPDDVWAVGSQKKQDAMGFLGSQVLVMRWDGGQWNVLDTPVTPVGHSGAFGRGVEAIAPDDVWFAGDFPGAPSAMLLHWDGSGFTQAPIGTPPPGPVGLEAVSAVASDDAWAVGGGPDADPASYSSILHWDGSTWDSVPGPAPGLWHRLYDVLALATDDVWATGDYFDGTSYHVLMLHWDGASWTQVAAPGGGAGLAALGPDMVYACGAGVVRWDGGAWSLVEDFHEVPDVTLAAIDVAWPCELFTVGRKIQPDITSFAARVIPVDVVEFCPAAPNSSGLAATLSTSGSTSVAANDLVFLGAALPAGTNGVVVYSPDQVSVPLGDGRLCVGNETLGFVLRLPSFTTSGAGAIVYPYDNAAPPDPSGQVLPGETWTFQLWFRDPFAGGAGFSSAVSVVFAP